MTNHACIGSISSGTLRTEDLLRALADHLESLDAGSRYAELIAESRAIDARTEEAREVLGELEEALVEFAPPYCFFGAHPGDGADFGYWPDWEAIEADRRDGELSSGGDLPARGAAGRYFLHISDHGNAELYRWDSRARRWRSEWGIV